MTKPTHDWDQVSTGIPLATGKRHRIVVPAQELVVRFEIDPEASEQFDNQRFTLMGGDKRDAPKYTQTKSGKDDLVKGDAYLDLRFTGLVPEVSYWLEVDPGDGRPKYDAFAAVPWSKIREA